MSESADSLVKIDSVSATRSGKPILEDISWEIHPGEHWVILGPNGAGKTTLVRLLSGMEVPSSGKALILGNDLGDHDRASLASQVGFASSEVGMTIPSDTTVINAVLTAAWGQISRYTEEYEGQDLERGHDLLAALGIGDLGERPLHSLSEGEVRRVLLARSLMANPEIIVLDEPTAGLDLGGRETLLGALHEIMTGRKAPTVVMVTHEPEQIGSSFSHALLLKNGHIAHSGLIDDVITGEKLSEVFEVPLRVSHEDGRFLVRTSEN